MARPKVGLGEVCIWIEDAEPIACREIRGGVIKHISTGHEGTDVTQSRGYMCATGYSIQTDMPIRNAGWDTAGRSVKLGLVLAVRLASCLALKPSLPPSASTQAVLLARHLGYRSEMQTGRY